MAKNNIITATEELVKELKGEVPEGETPPAHNRVIHTSLGGEGLQTSSYFIQAPFSPHTIEGSRFHCSSVPHKPSIINHTQLPGTLDSICSAMMKLNPTCLNMHNITITLGYCSVLPSQSAVSTLYLKPTSHKHRKEPSVLIHLPRMHTLSLLHSSISKTESRGGKKGLQMSE